MLVVNANRQFLTHLLEEEVDLKVRAAHCTPYMEDAKLSNGTSLVMDCATQEVANWFVSHCKRLAGRIRGAFPIQEISIRYNGEGVAIALSELSA